MKLGPMDPAEAAVLLTNKGIRGNANIGGKRQVTIIQQEVWEELCRKAGKDLDPRGRRANLMVRGIDLVETRGKYLQIGNTILKVNGETKPCERMDEFCMGLKELMYQNWGGGAYAEVVSGGTIHVGDPVTFIEKLPGTQQKDLEFT